MKSAKAMILWLLLNNNDNLLLAVINIIDECSILILFIFIDF